MECNKYIQRYEEFAYQCQLIIHKIKQYANYGNLLDVGCGVGILLDVAKKSGFAVHGVEISQWASDYARQRSLDVIEGEIIDAGFPDAFFDVVVLNHVLEHLPEPRTVLEEVGRILKREGLLVIGVPNFGSYMAKFKKKKWMSLLPEEHIWHFTHSSLLNLLSCVDFEEIYFEAKENHRVTGWRPNKIFDRIINTLDLMNNNAEAMLLFAKRKGSSADSLSRQRREFEDT